MPFAIARPPKGPRLWQREGNLDDLSEMEFRAIVGDDVVYERLWSEANDPRGG